MVTVDQTSTTMVSYVACNCWLTSSKALISRSSSMGCKSTFIHLPLIGLSVYQHLTHYIVIWEFWCKDPKRQSSTWSCFAVFAVFAFLRCLEYKSTNAEKAVIIQKGPPSYWSYWSCTVCVWTEQPNWNFLGKSSALNMIEHNLLVLEILLKHATHQ